MVLKRWPKVTFRPPGNRIPYKIIPPGSKFVRIFDTLKARSGGYGPFDYNPYLVEDRRDVRGRYSACKAKIHPDIYSYLYLGEHLTDERVVVLECIDILSLQRDEDDVVRRAPVALLEGLAFAYVRNARELKLLNISNRPFADVFHAPWEVLQGRNHSLTRRWARYFRRVCPGIDGLYYCPVPYGTSEHGGNIILFASHGMNGDHLEDDFRIVHLASPKGRDMLFKLEEYTNLCFL